MSGFDHHQFRAAVIQPALTEIGLYSADAEELLILTMATESLGGYYLFQKGGPALGVFEMEPATHDDLWRTTIHPRAELYKTMHDLYFPLQPTIAASVMVYNLKYAAAMARIFYFRAPDALPPASDVNALANYYKKYWNTALGAAEIQNVIDNYHRFIGAR